MRSNTLIRGAGLGLAVALFLSCAPKKRVLHPESSGMRVSGVKKMTVLDRATQQQLHYTTFSGRAKSSVTVNGKDRYDATANVRIVRDEAIWISVTALMGIEVARILITPDSIKLINRLQGEYINKPFAYLRNYTGSGMDFPGLQRLLTGDVIPPLMGDGTEVWQNTAGYLLQAQTHDLQYAAQLGTDYQTSHTSVVEPAYDQRLEARYFDYQVSAGNAFPHQMEISIVTPRLRLQSSMNYSRVVYDDEVSLPFGIPSRYTEIQ